MILQTKWGRTAQDLAVSGIGNPRILKLKEHFSCMSGSRAGSDDDSNIIFESTQVIRTELFPPVIFMPGLLKQPHSLNHACLD